MKLYHLALTTMTLGLHTAISEVNDQSSNELFPVLGVTLGVTTESELADIGKKGSQQATFGETTREVHFYTVRGHNFWIKDGVANNMYLTKPNEWPLKWRNYGFSWYASYNEWLLILEQLGFEIYIPRPPQLKQHRGEDSFYAEIYAEKHGPTPVHLTLQFAYSGETSEDAEGTLYSIRIKRP